MRFDLNQVDVLDFLDALGMRNIEEIGDEVNYSCPFDGHLNGDSKPSAYMNVETTAFYCHGCKRSGNAVQFLQRLENISPLEAARHIRERYQSDFREPGDSLLQELDGIFFGNFEEEIKPVAKLRNIYEVDWTSREALSNIPKGCSEYIFNRGFRPETLVEWGVGYCHEVDRIVLPIMDSQGILRGFKGRSWRPGHTPKYLALGDIPGRAKKFGFPTYEKSSYVFGLHRKRSSRAVVAEGEFNAIALAQIRPILNYTPVALQGSDISQRQIRQITSNFEEAIIFFDSDKAGLIGTQKVTRELIEVMPVKIVGAHEKDPADLTADECVRLIETAKSPIESWLPGGKV